MTKPAGRGRGRPRANQTDAQAQNSRVDTQTDPIEAAHSSGRPPRVPMGATLKLEFGSMVDDPNYHFRVFSDHDGRIEQAKQAYYEYVKDSEGSNVARHSGPYTQFRMKIKKEYWVEDQELKQGKLVAKLQQEQKLQKDEYLPDGRHHALQKDEYDPLA